jgi:deoxycytidylate deaminase
VPKAHGGLYWCDDKPDRREFTLSSDSSDEHKQKLLLDTLSSLKDKGWLNGELSTLDVGELVRRSLEPGGPISSRSAIRNVIEFGRAVHGEMAAIVSAAQRGVSVAGCDMFVTTFPCHLCARHIVAAGIERVHYIEPYARSLATALYPDSIAIEAPCGTEDPVLFLPFVGVAPSQYSNLFSMTDRKTKDGRVKKFVPAESNPRFTEESAVYLKKELAFAAILNEVMNIQGLLF